MVVGARRSPVVLVGRGSPERGGIPTFLDTLVNSSLAHELDIELVNLGRAHERAGGRASAGNLRRSGADAWWLWQRMRRGDVVHLHTAFAPGVTVLLSGLLVRVARARGARVAVHVHGGQLALWRRRAPGSGCSHAAWTA
jgi:hypothetical protein